MEFSSYWLHIGVRLFVGNFAILAIAYIIK